MKSIIYRMGCSSLLFLLIYNLSFGQSNKGFIIHGKLLGLKDGYRLYLVHNLENGGLDTIGTAISRNEEFKFEGSLQVEGEAYFIKIEDRKKKKDSLQTDNKYITLLLENSKIEIVGFLDSLSRNTVLVKGSKTHLEYLEIRNLQDSIGKVVNDEISRLGEAFARKDTLVVRDRRELRYKRDSLVALIKEVDLDWVRNNSNSLIAPWIILSISRDVTELEGLYNILTKKAVSGKYGTELKKQIEVDKKTNIGVVFQNFSLPALTGNKVSLDEVVRKSKLTLVDFWASWCRPCRAAFPELKALYTQYNSKGFSIVGYSIDKSISDWEKAIISDSLPWFNVKGDETFVDNNYGISLIPMTFLLDGEGKVIEKDLQGEDLWGILAQTLGDSPWKEQNRLFLERNKKHKSIALMSSGLQYEVLHRKNGLKPNAESLVKIKYKVSLIDGMEIERGDSAVVSVNRVIKGLGEALVQMSLGERWRLYIPSELAYKENYTNNIIPGSALIFEVELQEILK